MGHKVRERDERSAETELDYLTEFRRAYVEPLLMLTYLHPDPDVRRLADALATECARVWNQAGFRIRSKVTG